MRPRLIDLYCGAGGAAMGYHQAGFEVVGVDHNPQPHYPFEFIQADCMALDPEYIASFDAGHASPPCSRYTMAARLHGNAETHPDLVDPTRVRLDASGLPWIMENVAGAPIKGAVMLCGTMFGLPIAKHRFFETSFPAFNLMPGCNHAGLYDPWHGKHRSADKMRQAQGTPWIPQQGGASRKRGVTGDLFNAIPPAYTEFLGGLLLEHIARKEAA